MVTSGHAGRHVNMLTAGCTGMIGCGMSRNFTQLLAWRWVTGVGSALQMSGSQLYLADISLSSNRARTLGTNQVHKAFPKVRSSRHLCVFAQWPDNRTQRVHLCALACPCGCMSGLQLHRAANYPAWSLTCWFGAASSSWDFEQLCMLFGRCSCACLLCLCSGWTAAQTSPTDSIIEPSGQTDTPSDNATTALRRQRHCWAAWLGRPWADCWQMWPACERPSR